MQKLIIIFLICFVFFSCTAERTLSRKYIKEGSFPDLLIFTPKNVYKENLKTISQLTDDYKFKTETERDSILIVNSVLLKQINEDSISKQYLINLIEELKNYGFRVFDELEIKDFLNNKKESFVINPAQIVIEEYFKDVYENEIIGDSIFYKTFSINALSYNVWFEVKKLNSDLVEFPVLFSENHINEFVDGLYKQNQLTGDVRYYYDIKPISSANIESLISYSVKQHASYFFDLFMNYAVSQKQEIHFPPRIYFHFDKKRNLLGPAGKKRFINME